MENLWLTEEVVKEAIQNCLPTIHYMMEKSKVKRSDLQIFAGSVTKSVMVGHEINLKKNDWEFPFDEIANSKFDKTIEYKMPTRELAALYPECVGKAGDTIYWGSWIDGDIVAACSGVEPWFDEFFSKMIVANIRAIITGKHQEAIAKGEHFL